MERGGGGDLSTERGKKGYHMSPIDAELLVSD